MSSPPASSARRNARVALVCAAVFVGMTGMAFAAVPFYKAFCQLTGFDGTPRRADAAPRTALDRTVTVRFDANVRGLPWTFTPSQVKQEVRIGAQTLAHYKVTNTGETAVTGQAVFNVVPEQAGAYFQKLDCFCFTDQTIQPGATVDMPVLYFIDPKYASDFDTKGKKEVTLSYTFFPSAEGAQTQAAAPANTPLSP